MKISSPQSKSTVKRKLLILSFAFVVFCACVFSGMGYYYLNYRNTIMQHAVVKSGKMAVWGIAQKLERNIISRENAMILDVMLLGENRHDRKLLEELQKRTPVIDTLFFYDGLPQKKLQNSKNLNKNLWLIQYLNQNLEKSPVDWLALYHFSGSYNNVPIQAGYIAFEKSKDVTPEYLIFTLNLDYIRTSLLPQKTANADPSLSNISIGPVQVGQADVMSEKGNNLVINGQFQNILPFWRVSADINTTGMSKRSRMEFIVYSGIIFLILFFICLSIYFIWDQMRQEQKLSQVKSEVMTHLSHELKTPLSLIRMYSETLMLGRVASADKIRTYYGIILSECDRLHLLINNMLDFSRIEKGMKEYNFKQGDMPDALENIIISYSYYLKQHGFKFQTDIDRDMPSFLFDRVAIVQVIGNLLDNAIKFSPNKKIISLNLSQKENNIQLKVTDKGIGMKPDTLQEIFKPYHRLSSRFRGSGIGLSLVKHAVEAHGGTIQVQSEEGKGSTFIISFPLSPKGNDIV